MSAIQSRQCPTPFHSRRRQGYVAVLQPQPPVLQLQFAQQGLTPERLKSVLVGMKYHEEPAVGRVYYRTMPLAPPPLISRLRAQQRVKRRILPWTKHALAACLHNHVAGRRSCRAAFCGKHIVIVAHLFTLSPSIEKLSISQSSGIGQPLYTLTGFPLILHPSAVSGYMSPELISSHRLPSPSTTCSGSIPPTFRSTGSLHGPSGLSAHVTILVFP